MSSPQRMAASSSGSGNSKDFEDYVKEVQDIDKGRDHTLDSGDDDSSKTPDGKKEVMT